MFHSYQVVQFFRPRYSFNPHTSYFGIHLLVYIMKFARCVGRLSNTKANSLVTFQVENDLTRLRHFHTAPACHTDGIYRDLTNMRVRTPWVEALRKQREEGDEPTKKSTEPSTPTDRDLTPKKLSDSFHSVVRMTIQVRHSA